MEQVKGPTGHERPQSEIVVVAVGASAGGLEAFKKLLSSLSPGTREAFLFIQHADPAYDSSLPEILQEHTSLSVRVMPTDGNIQPATIYVLPPGMIAGVSDGRLCLYPSLRHRFPPNNIDVLFSSVAEVYQAEAIGILLSGMGSDGSLGLEKIKAHGGVTLVQTPSTAAFPAMPQNAIDAGIADFTMIPEAMGPQISLISGKIYEMARGASPHDSATGEGLYKQVLNLLRKRKQTDFTHYKESTIRRRILRRIVINHVDRLEDYVRLLENKEEELDILYDDLLIPVSAFFRDEEVFRHLCDQIFPDLIEHRTASLPVRIWIAGCSTGEEAYSMAICLHEFLGDNATELKAQIFATDISEKAIRKARNGIYTTRETEGVSPERLEQYFNKTDGHYQLEKKYKEPLRFCCS